VKNRFLNNIFAVEVVFFALFVLGVLPRDLVVYFVIFLAAYVLAAKTEDSTIFFVRSIPFFLAIPLTTNFDNFNTWRILSAIIFIKWGWPKINLRATSYKLQTASWLLIGLLLLAVLSIIPAPDKVAAVKRVIYFVNLSLIGMVIYDLTRSKEFTKRLIRNIFIPVILVTIVGLLQVASTYFMDIYQFMRLWGEGIQCVQFGNQWCNIATWEGNTWFAYYGEQLSLRVFSLFTDSHTFPMFILMGLPAIFAISLQRIPQLKHSAWWIPMIFLVSILSGTRGIWAASIGVVILAGITVFRLAKPKKDLFKYISLYLVLFFMLFVVAYPIFVSPQFLVSKGDWGLLGNRVRSIIDFGETSNAQRIAIWKASWESIKQHPLLGVGIGNFPVVLNQDVELAKAGSSAHNLYIHIAAEMGLAAIILAVWFFWLLFKKNYTNFVKEGDHFLSVYYAASLLFIPWILIYLLTDAALFDERAFLMFATVTSIILGKRQNDNG